MQTPQDSHSAALAMELSNQGVQLLQAGKYGEAVNVFSDVLAFVKALLNGQEQDTSMSNSRPPAPFCTFLINHQSLHGSPEGALFLFANPIVVNCQRAGSVAFQDLVRMSIISLYNLALTYHMAAAQAQQPAKMLRKALSFYELAHKLQTPDDDELGVLLTMAIVNNTGHVHGVVGNDTKAKQCFQYLLSTIMYLTEGGEADDIPQLEGFVRNVQNSVLKQPSAPAA